MATQALRAVEAWFTRTGRTAFAFQRDAWQAYLDGASGLINAPTGTGKTLAAWLGPVIEAITVRQPSRAVAPQPAAASRAITAPPRGGGLRVLWITPLRALANDLVGNLRQPL